MRAIVFGANGAMGKHLCALLGEQVAGRVSIDGENGVAKTFSQLGKVEADVVIDFSHHSAADQVLASARTLNCGVVMGTTGHTREEKQLIYEAAEQIPVFFCGNMSLGVAVLCKLVKQAVVCFPDADVEILEMHHNRKVDAPSGTARMLLGAVQEVRTDAFAHCGRAGEGRRNKNEVGISSLRMGNVVGIHEVHITTESQSLVLRHEAGDRRMFAQGAMEAAEFIIGRPAGLYNMDQLLACKF